jgi:hypothetical protein
MNLIRVGRRWLNLDFLVQAEDCDPASGAGPAGPDSLRVTMYPGMVIGFGGGDADHIRQRLGELISESRPGTPGPGPPARARGRAPVSGTVTLDPNAGPGGAHRPVGRRQQRG